MLVTMKEILLRANKGGYAVAAPNVCSELDARGALEAAEELNAPVILAVAGNAHPDMVFFGRYLTELCARSKVPAAINLDHGTEYAQAIRAIRAGFTSIMIDRSTLPFEENVREVSELVKVAHSVGVTVEAELGHVGQGQSYDDDRDAGLTDPNQAKEYIERTGVDCLAVAIGTAHGAYKGVPHLDFARLEKISQVVGADYPLVLHGSSGTGNEALAKACTMGINKVNIAYDLMKAANDAVIEARLEGNGIYSVWDVLKKGYREKLKRQIEVFGSAGKAWTVIPEGMPRADIVMEEK